MPASDLDYIDIVFDGPPAPESGRFVEVENAARASISFGEWVERDDGYWVLRIQNIPALLARVEAVEAENATLMVKMEDAASLILKLQAAMNEGCAP